MPAWVDVGIATDAETASLTEWKKCRVMLIRVDTLYTSGIIWPFAPE
ncbi:tail fiber assembly protein [Enterobacter sp. ECC-019]